MTKRPRVIWLTVRRGQARLMNPGRAIEVGAGRVGEIVGLVEGSNHPKTLAPIP